MNHNIATLQRYSYNSYPFRTGILLSFRTVIGAEKQAILVCFYNILLYILKQNKFMS